ncbi:hypothetical protein L596_013942 [Steinernema carpocapsae]|uniref:Uncharacterized protein n=1 Tax=Steinernema carpocapsae TaxID=34508 RepID=A0A4U5NAN3_STECR|nr:hypothetical protein L596_013942 [Steinernema carpocapsae]
MEDRIIESIHEADDLDDFCGGGHKIHFVRDVPHQKLFHQGLFLAYTNFFVFLHETKKFPFHEVLADPEHDHQNTVDQFLGTSHFLLNHPREPAEVLREPAPATAAPRRDRRAISKKDQNVIDGKFIVFID